MTKESIKPFAWGIAVGAIAILILVFATGWVVTSNSAQSTAETLTEKTVTDRLAAICVAQFQQDPDKEERLKELKEIASWKRSDFAKAGGWATMPGEETPDRKVASACAKQLIALAQ